MINVNYLRNGGSIISQTYISKNKELEQEIMKKLLKKNFKSIHIYLAHYKEHPSQQVSILHL